MPRTKKKKPGESEKKSKNLANLFFIVNVILLLILLVLKTTYNVPSMILLSTWLLITAFSLLFLWINNRKAAKEALAMLSRPT
ncbi:MAG: hypothetical protein RTU63_13675 [Candidatus Thorarchaeota archaeon]